MNIEVTQEEHELILNHRRRYKIDFLNYLHEELEQIQDDIKCNHITRALNELGFSIVYHERDKYSFIDYKKGQKEITFYEIRYENGELKKMRDDVTDEDFEKVKNILKVKGE